MGKRKQSRSFKIFAWNWHTLTFAHISLVKLNHMAKIKVSGEHNTLTNRKVTMKAGREVNK